MWLGTDVQARSGMPWRGTLAAGALDPQSPDAERIADLWWLMLWIGTAVTVIVLAILVVGLVRRGRGRSEDDVDPHGHGYQRWFVSLGVVVPAAILVVVFVATLVAMRAAADEAPPDALVVEIVGHQWWYEVRYPEQGVTLRNELRIPVGEPVELRLTSADVIHSFWVPELGGKRDLLPDDVNTLVLQADEPGEHVARCAEFCGLHHTTMHMTVVAEPADDFESWIGSR